MHLTVSFLLVISPLNIVTQNFSGFASKESSPYFTSNIRRIREIRELEKTISFVIISGVAEVD